MRRRGPGRGDRNGERSASTIGWRCNLVFFALMALFVFLAMEGITSNPVMVDEYGHVPAGISHWHLGDFQMYRENPPLVCAVSALPVWLSGA